VKGKLLDDLMTLFSNSECTQTTITLSGADQLLLPGVTKRHRLILINCSLTNQPITLRFDGKAVVAGEGFVLNAFFNFWDSGVNGVPIGAIRVIGTAGEKVCAISFVAAETLYNGGSDA